MLTPDTSHGTNPATVTMAGYEVVKVATDERGGVDLDDLRAKVDDQVACLMLTNPNTLGVFDENIAEIASLVHDVGGTLYYDGANLNAIMGRSRPGDMGFDIVHLNLHKSFSQPHGGGGPGAGPDRRLRPDRAVPAGAADRPRRGLERLGAAASTSSYDEPKSIGRLRGFQGNFGVFVRSYAYIRSLGGDGLRTPRRRPCSTPTTCSRGCARAGPASTCRSPSTASADARVRPLRRARPSASSQAKTLDIAKRLLDYGFHPPTIYFPLLVDEALMFEPTETETRESLDELADAIEAILAEAESDPAILHEAPYTTPVRRLDEAARQPQAGRAPAARLAELEPASSGSWSRLAGVSPALLQRA